MSSVKHSTIKILQDGLKAYGIEVDKVVNNHLNIGKTPILCLAESIYGGRDEDDSDATESGIVTGGTVFAMAQTLANKIGRRIVVHRVVKGGYSKYGRPGRGDIPKTIRYSMGISGCVPETFGGMTITEVKGRLAMILDLVCSGVLVVPSGPTSERVDGDGLVTVVSHMPYPITVTLPPESDDSY